MVELSAVQDEATPLRKTCGIGDRSLRHVRSALFSRWGVVSTSTSLMTLRANATRFVLVGWDIFRWSCDACAFNAASDLYFPEWYNTGYAMK